MKNLTHKMAATIATIAVTASSGSAFAQEGGLGDVSEQIYASASSFPKLISTAAYICGIGLGVSGIYKLKQHIDKPDGNPLQHGLGRLAAGGGLLALPYMTSAMVGTVADEGGTGVQFGDVNSFEMSSGG